MSAAAGRDVELHSWPACAQCGAVDSWVKAQSAHLGHGEAVAILIGTTSGKIYYIRS
eukprot:COSAG01_NODE_30949_length_606_cov_1.802761_1_plen_56_part_10